MASPGADRFEELARVEAWLRVRGLSRNALVSPFDAWLMRRGITDRPAIFLRMPWPTCLINSGVLAGSLGLAQLLAGRASLPVVVGTFVGWFIGSWIGVRIVRWMIRRRHGLPEWGSFPAEARELGRRAA